MRKISGERANFEWNGSAADKAMLPNWTKLDKIKIISIK